MYTTTIDTFSLIGYNVIMELSEKELERIKLWIEKQKYDYLLY